MENEPTEPDNVQKQNAAIAENPQREHLVYNEPIKTMIEADPETYVIKEKNVKSSGLEQY